MNTKIYDIIVPLVAEWNKRSYYKVSVVQDEDCIIISPIAPEIGEAYLPSTIISNVAMLAEVYGFCYGIHARNNVPYILI